MSLIYDKRHFELSTGDADVSLFFCVLLKTCLIRHKEVFKTFRPLFTESTFYIIFQAFSAS